MTTEPICESDMFFGPYPEGHCFYIEKSSCYSKIQHGVPIAEFLLLKNRVGTSPVMWVVEAKSSTPRPETQPNFDTFIFEIREKLINAFSLGWASRLGRHILAKDELPEPFKNIDLTKTDIRFVLIIKDHKEEWLPPLQEALKKVLLGTIKTWSFSPTSVLVMNQAIAKEHGLIITDTGNLPCK